MSDSFTEVTHQSWLSRIGSSIKGILFGFLLFLAAFPLLFWNEGRAIKTEKSLKEGAAAVISIDMQNVDPANDARLVYLSGLATTDETLHDDVFNIQTQAISLSRKVEIYQWQERKESKTEKEMGGSTKTTTQYSYSKVWSSSLINSSSFKHPDSHQNPARKTYQDKTSYAKEVSIGQFIMNPTQIRSITGSQALTLSELNIPANSGAVIDQGGIYIGQPQLPQIGDSRVFFNQVKPTSVSIVAAQKRNTFAPYMTSVGQPIQLLTTGIVSAQEMFANELSNNTLLTWGLRLLGFVIMVIGLSMIMKPLTVLADVIPFVGNLLEIGTGLISGVIAFVFSLTTIAIAWFFYRPLISLAIIALVIAALALLKMKLKKAKNTRMPPSPAQTAAPPPPPPPS